MPLPVILGKFTAYVDAEDKESGIKKVEFYVDDILQEISYSPPYQFGLGKTFGIHEMTIAAYNNAENVEYTTIKFFGWVK